MTRSATVSRLAWQDRWKQPTFNDLLKPMAAQPRRAILSLIDRLEEFPHIQKSIVWYGPSWKWTIQYTARDDQGKSLDTLCYIVPCLDGPVVCIPLNDAMVERLPLRRLSKLVRNGIKVAKKAVEIHWATWRITMNSEIEQLMELVKRKHKLLLEPAKPKASAK